MKITSRLNYVNFIFLPFLLIFLLSAMAFLIMMFSFKEVENGNVDSILKTPIYGSVILLGVIFWTTIHYFKICKTIRIDSKGIKLRNLFKTEFLSWNDIQKVELFGKWQDTMNPTDAVTLIFQDGRQIAILAPFYKNMYAIRQTIQQVIDCKDSNKAVELTSIDGNLTNEPIKSLDLSKMRKYSNNHFLSFNGLFFYGINAFAIYMTINSYPHFELLLYLSLSIFAITFGFFGHQLHYFFLDKNHLVIKNHLWPWTNHTFRIENIKHVGVEVPYRRSTALRVVTKDYQSKVFSGGSLKSSTWKELLNDFQKLNVKTENEIL
jgi:hypothetical protein